MCSSFLLFPLLLLLCLCYSVVFSYSFVLHCSSTLSYSCAYNAHLLSLVTLLIWCITLLHLSTLHSLVHYTPSFRYFTFILFVALVLCIALVVLHVLGFVFCVCLILSPCILLFVKECGVAMHVELL